MPQGACFSFLLFSVILFYFFIQKGINVNCPKNKIEKM